MERLLFNSIEKTKIKEKSPGIAHFLKNSVCEFSVQSVSYVSKDFLL